MWTMVWGFGIKSCGIMETVSDGESAEGALLPVSLGSVLPPGKWAPRDGKQGGWCDNPGPGWGGPDGGGVCYFLILA